MPHQYTPKVPPLTLNCETCGTPFTIDGYAQRRGTAKYCSRACLYRGMDRRVERSCQHCGVTFLVKRSDFDHISGRGKYCSRQCKAATKNFTRPCVVCGTIVTRPNAWDRGETVYCSPQCQYPTSNGIPRICGWCKKAFTASTNAVNFNKATYCSLKCGGLARRKLDRTKRGGTLYNGWRTAVLQRDHHTCQHCGSEEHLHAHHVQRWSTHPTLRYDPINGLTLCLTCHKAHHRKV